METTTIPKNRGGRPTGTGAGVSDAVSRVRAALGLTQEEFARELGCSLSNVAKMEGQKRTPGSGALRTAFEKLARRSGVSLDKAEEVTP
jgi:transcriptional regulator with XRE-family HTH domain